MAKIIFFGSGAIGQSCLETLIGSDHEVMCVVTSPDKKKGRHLLDSHTPIKEIALKHNLSLFQPEQLNIKESVDYFKTFQSELFVVFAYGKILPKQILEIPSILPLNIHASLLPKYRGAAPIQRSLINGEKKTGVTFIRMDEKLDQGDMFFSKEIAIVDEDNAITLEEKLSKLAADNLLGVIKNITDKKIDFKKQDNSKATYAPKLTKYDGKIDWRNSAEQIINQMRGCFGWPGAFTYYKGNPMKVWQAQISQLEIKEQQVGKILSVNEGGILVSTAKDALIIKEVQLASGKRLLVKDFIKGHSLQIGEILS